MANLQMHFDEYIPLRDIVFKTLREAIITGDLKPGERLMEIKLANELGVSRTPVREAIRKLELEGLVIMTARKGAEVAPINEKDLKEVLEIRKNLESLACQLSCKNSTEDDIKALKEINKIIARAVKDDDIETITKSDVQFHELIVQTTQN
ncbi:MAG: GntR family transcriptional regulator, partial [Parasporobacterium sp.]|nr:GntR family transcriptional regulator [Parasporobacterium sp.]